MASEEDPAPDGAAARRLVAPLPDPAVDSTAMFERCLAEVLDALAGGGAAAPEGSRWQWQGWARRLIAEVVCGSAGREEWFAMLMRAAVYDPDPSFNRYLVEPAVISYGRRRVQVALLQYLRSGTNPERAGAARAWYWTLVPRRYVGGSSTATPESQAEYDRFADLRREWAETALRVFVASDDVDVRRCILPGLILRPQVSFPP